MTKVSINEIQSMIFKPNKINCKCNGIFDSLIQTREIKALTDFLEKSPWKSIKNSYIKLFKGESLTKPLTIPKKKISGSTKKDGGIYIVYLGNGLFKFGLPQIYFCPSESIRTIPFFL